MTSANSVDPSVMAVFQGEFTVHASERAEIIREVLERLENRERAVILLRMQEFSLADIGETFGISESQVLRIENGSHEKLRGFLADLKIHSLCEIA